MSNQKTIYELLNTLKDGACAAGTLALGTLGLACEGAEKLADAVKLRCRAARVESELDGELIEVGELAYAAYSGNSQVSDAMEEKMRTIDGLRAELAGLNETLGRGPEERRCAVCGALVEVGDHFCRSCGEKLE